MLNNLLAELNLALMSYDTMQMRRDIRRIADALDPPIPPVAPAPPVGLDANGGFAPPVGWGVPLPRPGLLKRRD